VEALGLQLSLRLAGRRLIRFGQALHGLLAFSLIVLGVAVTKSGVARPLIRPLIRAQVYLAGVRSLPFVAFVAAALGFLVIGQTVSLLTRVGADAVAGTVMVMAIVRELGPLAAALIVLARAGTIVVIELGTSRALGEVEALEALAIDPVHYLVVPRVIGLAWSVFSLTVYFILIALAGGYLFAFVQDVPLTPGEYVAQLAGALTWQDFALLALKTLAFGNIIGLAACYQGLARPLRLEDVAGVTTQAVVLAVVACVWLDLLFIVVYLLM
jgi:phospholipid/cholesterol/gamma-HCH transport system permease protein